MALLVTAPAAAETQLNVPKKQEPQEFASAIDDLPIMPGLKVQQDKDVLFIAPTGRVAQTTATGLIDIDEVYQFYQRTLPQLGWNVVDGRTYEREHEQLRIEASGVNPSAVTVVKFMVEPIKE